MLQELLETETDYVADLATVIDGFMAPLLSEMQSRQLVSSRQLEYIFSNIALIKKHGDTFCARLKDAIGGDGADPTYDCQVMLRVKSHLLRLLLKIARRIADDDHATCAASHRNLSSLPSPPSKHVRRNFFEAHDNELFTITLV